jgi:hypothetical protein
VPEADRIAVFDNDAHSTENPYAVAFARSCGSAGTATTADELKAGHECVRLLSSLTERSVPTSSTPWCAVGSQQLDTRFRPRYTAMVYQPMVELVAL